MRTITILLLTCVLLVLGGCAARTDTADRAPSGPTVTESTRADLIPANTEVVIRTNENITTDSADERREYDAEIANDIVNEDGTVLVRRGADAKLGVVKSDDDKLMLALRSVEVDGRERLVVSEGVERSSEGLGRNERTAKHVGGGAILGGLIGAVAGGAKGAAVGAAVGAAGGAAAQVITQGNEVRVPAESLLTFRLEEPIRLSGSAEMGSR